MLAAECNTSERNAENTAVFQVSTSAGQYTLSVNDLVLGSAEHTLHLLKQAVSEISAGKRSRKAEKCGEKNPQQHRTHNDRQSLRKTLNPMQCQKGIGKLSSLQPLNAGTKWTK